MAQSKARPGLCLIAQAGNDPALAARLAAMLDATDAVTLILTGVTDGPIDPGAARPLVEIAQKRSVAALIADDTATAKAIGADGVHLSWRPEIEDAYEAARKALGAEAIVGADAGASRHDAMALGEAGADYVAFGQMAGAYGPEEVRDARREFIAWWSEIFVVPVVGFGIETAGEAADLALTGADFVAVRLPDTADEAADRDWVAGLVAALRSPADAA
jgi:thiamine-phosphate pyrophosphorylase